MSYIDQGMSPSRMWAIVLVAILHALLAYAFVTGLAYKFVKNVSEDLKTFDVEEEPPPPEEEPPPPPKQEAPPPPVTAPPVTRVMMPSLNPISAPPPPPPAPAVVPTPPAPPPPRVSPPQRARANLGSYFSSDDYPASALRAEDEGTTGFRLTVGPNGRVTDCVVTSSSGSAALDAATCRILRTRARYTPARDSTGEAASGTDTGRVTWRIPAE